MPTVSMTDEMCREAIELVEEGLRRGYPHPDTGKRKNAKWWAAREAKERKIVKEVNTFYGRYREALKRGMEPDASWHRSPRYTQPVAKTMVHDAPPPNVELLEPEGTPERILVIGDLHQDPRHPDRRLEHMGQRVSA